MKSKAKDRKPVTVMIEDKISDPILDDLSLVSGKTAKTIALYDGKRVSTDPIAYSQKNWVTYYLILNTWFAQVDEISERGRLELHEAVVQQGLLQTIADCDGLANAFVHSYAMEERVLGSDMPHYLVHLLSSCENDKETLQVLRFPKRFSPDGADLIREASIDALVAVNNRSKSINRNGFEGWASFMQKRETSPVRTSSVPSRYWVDRVKDTLAEMLKGYSFTPYNGIFSTGVAADADRPLVEKLQQYGLWECCLYGDPLYPISAGKKHLNWARSAFSSELFCAVVQAVPKSYKTARIIAEEHAYRQYHMQAIRKEIERCLKSNGYLDYLDLHSQDRNQRYAEIGSRLGCYATIDLSSASDSLARSLAFEVLPSRLVSDVDTYLPRTFVVNGIQRTMHMFCTSGSAVTFPVESVVFLAIALSIRDVASALTGEFYLPPVVFGDDIVVDVLLYDTVTEVLAQLGFVVNTTKSYGPGTLYRESCGCEYICGYDLRSVYWPRTTFVWRQEQLATCIGQICALQHKVYGTFRAQKFLARFVRVLEPRMTSHVPGTECDDLWEAIPVFVSRHAPVLESCEVPPYGLREGHLALKTRYGSPGYTRGETDFLIDSLLEMWFYATFLKDGQTFDTELERLLGVSSKRNPLRHYMTKGTTFWGYVTE